MMHLMFSVRSIKFSLSLQLLYLCSVSAPLLADEGSGATSDALELTVAVPQTISVNSTLEAQEEVQKVVITVATNNGFDISFSGNSPLEIGEGTNPWPQFSKQDVDVTGVLVANEYDLLPTEFGLVVSGYSTVEFLDQWGGGATPVGTPQDLVLVLDQSGAVAGSPDEAIGRIMPGAEDMVEINLYVKAATSIKHQTGIYTMLLTATVVANPDN